MDEANLCVNSPRHSFRPSAASMTVTMASHPQVRGHFKDESVSDSVSDAALTYVLQFTPRV